MVDFPPFPDKIYNCLYIDPPWAFKTYSDKGKEKSPEKHYDCLEPSEIKNIHIDELSDKNCAMFLWTTYPHLQHALSLIRYWEYEYKTVAFTWVKTTKNGKWHMGTGYYTRANPEICLLATRGKIKVKDHSVRNLVVEPVGAHSAKPIRIRDDIVKLMGDLPRIELFQRGPKPEGWDVWGNEAGGAIE